MYSLLALTAGEKFSIGGTTTLLGLGMTFVVLILLICFIFLVNLIIKQLEKLQVKLADKKKQKKAAAEVVEETVEAEPVKEEIDSETMGAIQEAVKTYLLENDEKGKPHENFKIKSVTKL